MRVRHYAALATAGLVFIGGLNLAGAAAQGRSGRPAGRGSRVIVTPPPQPAPDFGGFGGVGFGGVPIDPIQLAALKALFVPPTEIPSPADNPSTPEKVALGQKLFFDPGLSADGRLACASCHDVRHGFAAGTGRSLGVKGEPLARHTPTVINLAWTKALFWDGRADTLEQQALMPIANADEMGMPHDVMVSHLQADAEYRGLFQRAFPGEGASVATVGKALAAFERTLVFADAPFDRWIAGDEKAISDVAKRGFVDFTTTAGCSQCHSGWNFSDGGFHDIGLPSDDVGRFGVEADETVRHAFKTPGLRNIAERAPYMHTGDLGSLGEVLRFYNRGFVIRDTLAPEMNNVRAGGGGAIIAFLETLTSPTPPELVRLQEALDRQTRGGGTPAVVASGGR